MLLTECLHASNNIDTIGVLKYSKNMKLILKKLPYQMHDKYLGIFMSRRQVGRPVTFETLVDFIKSEAKKSNDVIYGKAALYVDKPK